VLARHGAHSPFLNYHRRWAPTPFPPVLCVSVNGEVLACGDLVSVDFGAIRKSWCGDAARSFIVRTPRAQDTALIEATTRRWHRRGAARQHAGRRRARDRRVCTS
jgi:methionyl aminopeptidase